MADVRRDMLKWISDSKKIYGKRILCLNKMSKRQDWVRRIKMLSILLGSVDGRTDSLSGQRHSKLQAGRGGAAAPHPLATSQPNVRADYSRISKRVAMV